MNHPGWKNREVLLFSLLLLWEDLIALLSDHRIEGIVLDSKGLSSSTPDVTWRENEF